MTTYERVKPVTAGPVADTYLELKMLCLFYFAVERRMTTYERVKPVTAGPVADTYLELKMLCLFYLP